MAVTCSTSNYVCLEKYLAILLSWHVKLFPKVTKTLLQSLQARRSKTR